MNNLLYENILKPNCISLPKMLILHYIYFVTYAFNYKKTFKKA